MSRSGRGGDADDALERAADELAASGAQGQADVETATGPDGDAAGSDVEGGAAVAEARRSAGGTDPRDVAPDAVAPGPDAG